MKRSLLALLAGVTACAGNPAPVPLASHDAGAGISAGIARLRAATRAFQDLDSAVAAGYPAQVNQCYLEPGAGAMGYHHVNRALVDRQLEIERPEILLYERTADGRYTLTAVEYLVPYRVWPADSAPPQVMGVPLGHVDVLNTWGLHLWIWKENPNGMFAWWNPNVQCLADQTRLPEHRM